MVTTLFFVFVGVLVLGVIVCISNFAKMFNNPTDMLSKGGSKIATHLVSGGIAGIGSLGMTITGIIWLVGKFAG
tara:strand:- start:3362 stop:3583 length:222 start_codon:yes stop_codon:yes gene_type:complete